MADSSLADWVTAAGTTLAGLAAVAAVVLGWATAKAWREQARATKEAELAGEALVVVVPVLRAARRSNVGYRTAPHMADAVHTRWAEMVGPAEAALQTIAARAAAYLPEPIVEVLLEVLKEAAALHADQWLWAMAMDIQTSTPTDFKEVFGSGRVKVLQELEERARTVAATSRSNGAHLRSLSR